MRALANELTAHLLLLKKKYKAAEVYLIEALTAYEQYGALAKVNSLSDKYHFHPVALFNCLLQPSTYPTLQWKKVVAKSTQNSLGSIDFHSVLTASHSLSEEIVLPRLLSKLMSILFLYLPFLNYGLIPFQDITMENAGAERGYLLLPKQDEKDALWTAAESIGDQVQIYVSDTTQNKPDLCEGVSFFTQLHIFYFCK
jgi:hypothetical protein